MTRDLVEKTVTEVMSGALKYCDPCEPGSARHHQYQVIKQIFFHPKIFWVFTKRLRQVRAGMIHHRLASLYHHSYRATLAQEARSRKLRQLAELHYDVRPGHQDRAREGRAAGGSARLRQVLGRKVQDSAADSGHYSRKRGCSWQDDRQR